jgi:hypothetical protein
MKFKTDNETLISILVVLIAVMLLMWVALGSKIYQNETHLYKIQAHTLELLERQEAYNEDLLFIQVQQDTILYDQRLIFKKVTPTEENLENWINLYNEYIEKFIENMEF